MLLKGKSINVFDLLEIEFDFFVILVLQCILLVSR